MDIVSIDNAKTWDGRMFDSALFIVNRHSGLIDAYTVCKKGLTSKQVAFLMHERWIPIMGIPQEICSDLGQQFKAQWFKTFCALKGIMHAEAISYRSQTNGRAEHAISLVLDALRKIHQDKGLSWPEALPQALQHIRCTTGVCGLSPSQVVFGRDDLQQGLPLPVEQKAEDALEFHTRILRQDAIIKKAIDDMHSKRQATQTAGKSLSYNVGQKVQY
jgi:hypothetical protein